MSDFSTLGLRSNIERLKGKFKSRPAGSINLKDGSSPKKNSRVRFGYVALETEPNEETGGRSLRGTSKYSARSYQSAKAV